MPRGAHPFVRAEWKNFASLLQKESTSLWCLNREHSISWYQIRALYLAHTTLVTLWSCQVFERLDMTRLYIICYLMSKVPHANHFVVYLIKTAGVFTHTNILLYIYIIMLFFIIYLVFQQNSMQNYSPTLLKKKTLISYNVSTTVQWHFFNICLKWFIPIFQS